MERILNTKLYQLIVILIRQNLLLRNIAVTNVITFIVQRVASIMCMESLGVYLWLLGGSKRRER